MTCVIEKMLRSANLMQLHCFNMWKNATFTDKEKRTLMKRNRTLSKAIDTLERKRLSHLKCGYNAIAKDCVNTKTK